MNKLLNYSSFLLIIILTSISPAFSQPNHHLLKPPSSPPLPPPPPLPPLSPKEAIEITPPIPTTSLPIPSPQCILHLFNHSFANTFSQPPLTLIYSPLLNCSPPWNHAVLQFSGEVSGKQSSRIAGVWLSGVEILRTNTPESGLNGSFWSFSKDITRYSSLLQQSDISLSMMLENVVDAEFNGIINVSLSILFYKNGDGQNFGNRKLGLGFQKLGVGDGVYDEPADLVIPIANEGNNGYWFRIEEESEVGLKRIQIPINTKRIVLELYVSFHGNDEIWYTNPPNEYIEMNHLNITRRNGASRKVYVKIDGQLVGYEVPFPIISTRAINPFSWDPIVGIGAFDLPSYDYELTPFLSLLLDGESHSFEFGVTDAIDFWLVDANLHLYLDKESIKVEAGIGVSKAPEFEIERKYKFKQLDGSFEIEMERMCHSSGWVSSSLGNFTTNVDRELKYKNSIKFEQNGSQKTVEQEVKVKTEVRVVSDAGLLVSLRTFEGEYPLNVEILTVPGLENDISVMSTNIKLELKEKSYGGNSETSLENVQESSGSMIVKDNSVVSGTAQTRQKLKYKGPSGCFSRTAEANGGKLLVDSSSVCSSRFNNNHEKMLSAL
ncbi:peptide-N4-(N-acetyl-beta-glucosaminyl)asparagine amidase A-like [Amaranthus tricolor]|uniref:peptide-N4-(N-acetyl-beta- glucosaminyl)asparagine amidase A-like n=1 Tax=Amaranthus tricolor TaxID=29722 RepID=UPI0025825D85|nr:peptide-N4-(N-acetyl-beta-glucosaminyl)asparagine amidase A-like [Amaranthus tricolor]